MIEELRNKELSIDHERHQIGDVEGLTFLQQMSQMVADDRCIEALEKQGNLSSAFVEDFVLLGAACLDDWSSQKDQQEHTRKLRNDIAHGGDVKSDIETIKRYLFDGEYVGSFTARRWDIFYQNTKVKSPTKNHHSCSNHHHNVIFRCNSNPK